MVGFGPWDEGRYLNKMIIMVPGHSTQPAVRDWTRDKYLLLQARRGQDKVSYENLKPNWAACPPRHSEPARGQGRLR